MREAQQLCKEAWLRTDLSALRSKEKPLCDAKSKLTVRTASAEEDLAYQQSADPTSEDLSLVYLVEIDGVTGPHST